MYGGYVSPTTHASTDPASIASGALAANSVTSGTIASGQVGWPHLSAIAVRSGQIGSGTVLGQAGGGPFVIASGTLGTNDYASGSVVSGTIASGQIGFGHLANASVRSGTIASGTINWPHIFSGSIVARSGILIEYTASGIFIGRNA